MQLVLETLLATLVRQGLMTQEEVNAVSDCVCVGYEDCPDDVIKGLSRLMQPVSTDKGPPPCKSEELSECQHHYVRDEENPSYHCCQKCGKIMREPT